MAAWRKSEPAFKEIHHDHRTRAVEVVPGQHSNPGHRSGVLRGGRRAGAAHREGACEGPAEIEKLITGLLAKVPAFRLKNLKVWIDTPDKVFAEYSVEALVPDTGKVYRQTYAGVLIAEGGRIKLLREALDTAAAAWAFAKD